MTDISILEVNTAAVEENFENINPFLQGKGEMEKCVIVDGNLDEEFEEEDDEEYIVKAVLDGIVEAIQKDVADENANDEEGEEEEEEEDEGEEMYVVEEVRGKRITRKGFVEYLLKWEGYARPTWELWSNTDCNDLIEEFEEKRRQAARAKEMKIVNKMMGGKRPRFSLPSAPSPAETEPPNKRVRFELDESSIDMAATEEVTPQKQSPSGVKSKQISYRGVKLATATKESLCLALHKKNIEEGRLVKDKRIGEDTDSIYWRPKTTYIKPPAQKTISEEVSRFIVHCISSDYSSFPRISDFTAEESRFPDLDVEERKDCLLLAIRIFYGKTIPLNFIKDHILLLKKQADDSAHLKLKDGQRIPYLESTKQVAAFN